MAKEKESQKLTANTGFGKKPISMASKYGFSYNLGETRTIKADMKEGEFSLLGGVILGDELRVQLLKNVPLRKTILYPSSEDGKQPTPHDWQHLFYLDADGVLCGTLIKSYTLSHWENYLFQLEKAGLDYTAVHTTMIISTDKSKTTKFGKNPYVVNFYFCKDGKGKPCAYGEFEKGEFVKNEDAVIDFVDDDQYARSAEFYGEFEPSIFDARVIEEIIDKNTQYAKIKNAANYPILQKVIYTAYQSGYMTEDDAKKILMQVQPKDMPQLE